MEQENMGFRPGLPIEKKIVTESCGTIRTLARSVLKGHWFDAMLVLLTVFAVTNIPVYIVMSLANSSFVSALCNVYMLVVKGPLTLGMSYYYLRLFRQQDNGVKDMAIAKEYVAQSMVLYMHILLRIIVGSILFVIPGIVMALNYSQCFYILAENPRKMPFQCLMESKYLMKGNRIKYILLSLSFLGWYIIASIPQGLAETFIMPSDIYSAAYTIEELASIMSSVVNNPIVVMLSLLTLAVEAYMTTAHAAFYDIMTCKLSVGGGDFMSEEIPF